MSSLILKNLELTNTFPNREIYINTLDKSFKTSIKDESFNIIKENKINTFVSYHLLIFFQQSHFLKKLI